MAEEGDRCLPVNHDAVQGVSGLVLSMALQRQNLQDQARQAFDRAAEVIDRHQSQYSGDFGPEWCDWLMCLILRREAEATLGLIH